MANDYYERLEAMLVRLVELTERLATGLEAWQVQHAAEHRRLSETALNSELGDGRNAEPSIEVASREVS